MQASTTPKNRRPQSKSALASLPERKGASYVNTGILLNTVNTKMDRLRGGPFTTVYLTLWEYDVTYDLRISAKIIWNSFFFNIGVLATCLPVILA